MKRLKIMYSMQQCKNLKICEKELELEKKYNFLVGEY
jgi:hypothetical protein